MISKFLIWIVNKNKVIFAKDEKPFVGFDSDTFTDIYFLKNLLYGSSTNDFELVNVARRCSVK